MDANKLIWLIILQICLFFCSISYSQSKLTIHDNYWLNIFIYISCYIERNFGIQSSTKDELVFYSSLKLNSGLTVIFIGTENCMETEAVELIFIEEILTLSLEL